MQMEYSRATGLAVDRSYVEHYLCRLLEGEAGESSGTVFQAMRYAVLGPAQRVRPILALRVARMLGTRSEATMQGAGAVELVHCASLIVDDLPCMDNSPWRRGQAATHVRFGEATALLAAFGLVALAARSIVEAPEGIENRSGLLDFQLLLLRALDCSSLLAGQALDLELGPCRSLAVSEDHVSEFKTVPLFDLAVRAGTLGANPDANQTALLSCFGRSYGLAFQMSDNLLDGDACSGALFEEKLTTLRAVIAPFGAASRDLEELVDYLHARIAAPVFK
jgi:geranylgeranyl pyrophosphate synthase